MRLPLRLSGTPAAFATLTTRLPGAYSVYSVKKSLFWMFVRQTYCKGLPSTEIVQVHQFSKETSHCASHSRAVQYNRTESDRLRYAPTRLAGSPITTVMSLQRVGKVGGSSRSDTDGHDPSL